MRSGLSTGYSLFVSYIGLPQMAKTRESRSKQQQVDTRSSEKRDTISGSADGDTKLKLGTTQPGHSVKHGRGEGDQTS